MSPPKKTQLGVSHFMICDASHSRSRHGSVMSLMPLAMVLEQSLTFLNNIDAHPQPQELGASSLRRVQETGRSIATTGSLHSFARNYRPKLMRITNTFGMSGRIDLIDLFCCHCSNLHCVLKHWVVQNESLPLNPS